MSSRLSYVTSFCRNCSYDCCWISMRFGISTMDGILLKSRRTRRPHAIVPAIHPPRPGRWGSRRVTRGESSPEHPASIPSGRHLNVVGASLHAPGLSSAARAEVLLHFHRSAHLLELLLHVRRLALRNLLLHRLGCAVDQVLGFLQAKSGQLAHDLDHLDLL